MTDYEILQALKEVDEDDSFRPSDWETGFLESMMTKLQFAQFDLSEKQRESCLKLIERYHNPEADRDYREDSLPWDTPF